MAKVGVRRHHKVFCNPLADFARRTPRGPITKWLWLTLSLDTKREAHDRRGQQQNKKNTVSIHCVFLVAARRLQLQLYPLRRLIWGDGFRASAASNQREW